MGKFRADKPDDEDTRVDITPIDIEFTPVTEIRTWVFNEDTGSLTAGDMAKIGELMGNLISRAFEEGFYKEVTNTKPAPAHIPLYSQNYKSALFDKNGKFVKVIDDAAPT